ncbi:MAG: hypothetical protein ACFFBL_10395 [Promethearchaeota archaeon]
MDKSVMFNGRLGKDDVDVWLNLLVENSASGFKDRELAKAFLMLEECITFASSLDNKIIGGTSIYRDRTRLAMVLASVAVDKEFRESATYQIIKSSMPFFKTVAIRDVDALVSVSENKNLLGFPLNLELDSWITDILKRIGFSEVNILDHYTFSIESKIQERTINWAREVNAKEVRELIWDQSKPMGLTNSLVWLARDFAVTRRCLETTVVNGQIAGVAGIWKVGNTLCVSPCIIDPEKLNWKQIAGSFVAKALESGVKYIDLPFVGEGQYDLIRSLENTCSVISCRKLSLMRKPL